MKIKMVIPKQEPVSAEEGLARASELLNKIQSGEIRPRTVVENKGGGEYSVCIDLGNGSFF